MMDEQTEETFGTIIRDDIPRKMNRPIRSSFPKMNQDESRPTFAQLSHQHKFQRLRNFSSYTTGDDDEGDNVSIYSGAGIKMEAFDCFHKVLNRCVSDFSFTIRDAAGILKLLTPDIIKTILPLLTTTIRKQSSQPETPPKKRDSQSDYGEEALDYEISEINKEQIERGEAEITGCAMMSKRPLAPRPPDSLDTTTRSSSPGSNSCSPVSAAVQALISISAPVSNNTVSQPVNSVKKLTRTGTNESCEVVEGEAAMFRPLSKPPSRQPVRNPPQSHSMKDLSESIHAAIHNKSNIVSTVTSKERKGDKCQSQEINETMIISSKNAAISSSKRSLLETNETMTISSNDAKHSATYPSHLSSTSVIMTSTPPEHSSSSAHSTHHSSIHSSLLTTTNKLSGAYTSHNSINSSSLLAATQQMESNYPPTNPPPLTCETYTAVSTSSLQSDFAQCKLSASQSQTSGEPMDTQQSSLVHQGADPMMNSYDLLLTTPSISDLPCGLQSPFNHQMPASPLPSMMSDSLETGDTSVGSTKHIPPLLPSIPPTDLSTESSAMQTSCPQASVSNPNSHTTPSINTVLQPPSTETTHFIEHSDGNFVTDPQVVTAAVRVQAPLRTILPKPSVDHPSVNVSMVSVLSLTNAASNSLSQISPVIKIDDKRLQYGSIPPNQIFTKIRPVATSVVMTVPSTLATAAATVSVAQPRQIFPNQLCYFSAPGMDSLIFPQNAGKEPLKNFFTINSQSLVPQQLTKVKSNDENRPTSSDQNSFKVSDNVATSNSDPVSSTSANSNPTSLPQSNLGPPMLKAENRGGNLEVASALLSMASENESSENKVEEGDENDAGEGETPTIDDDDDEDSFQKIILESLQEERSNIQVVFTNTGTVKIKDVEINPLEHGIKKGSFTCGKCQHMFTSVLYLTRHIKRVCPDMSQRKWKCDRCEKAFRHPFGLQQHIYTHTGERPHKCTQCPKAFYSSNDLRRHARTHSGERPYQCTMCEKSFSTTISLKTHQYIHTGERPHKCPHCPKTFATSSKLSRHIVTHSEKRPFPCDQCSKTFNRSGDLRRHYNQQHGNPHALLECNHCNKTFATHKCLVNHQITHNRDGEKSTAPPATNTSNENTYFEQLKYTGVSST